MSILNRKLLREALKRKKPYDPDKKYDYKKMREEADKVLIKPFDVPEGITLKRFNLNKSAFLLMTKESNPKDKIIYHIHGGGFSGGNIERNIPYLTYVVDKLGYNIIGINYPLAPEHPFPEGLYECVKGYEYLLKEYDGKNIVLIGGSAGGNLVLAILLKIKEKKLPIPGLAFPLSACLQFDQQLESYTKNEKTCVLTNSIIRQIVDTYLLGDEKLLKNPFVAPLYGDFAGLCPIYIFVSKSEILYDDSVLMYKRLLEQGVKTKLFARRGLVHVWVCNINLREGRRDLRVIKRLIDKTLK